MRDFIAWNKNGIAFKIIEFFHGPCNCKIACKGKLGSDFFRNIPQHRVLLKRKRIMEWLQDSKSVRVSTKKNNPHSTWLENFIRVVQIFLEVDLHAAEFRNVNG